MEGNGVIEAQDQTGVDSRFQVMGAVNCTGAKSYTLGKWTTGTPPIVRCNTGLGPLDYFGRTMVANLPANIKVGVVPVAIGGCDIALFDKVNYGAYVATAPTWMIGTINQYGGNPYARLLEVAKLAQKDGVIKCILFHQGETNNGQQDWPSKVKAIYDNLIRDLGLDPTKTPFLAGELVTTAQGGACGGHNSIIAKLPSIIPNSYVISAAGLPHKGDNLHFTPASYRTLGQRYAQLMLTLLSKGAPVISIIEPTTNTVYKQGDNVTINTTATITIGNITKVDFYTGTTLLNSDLVSPYTYSWTNVLPGTYKITAVATDNSGNKTTSSAVTITVVPLATITAAGATTFCSGSSVVLNSNTGTGYTYQWKNGATTIAGATASSYTVTASGSYTVNVSANSQTTSSVATVITANVLPVISQYAQINGGVWNQTSTATLCSGSTIVVGPKPTTTTGWTWTGPNGYSATTREITLASVATNQGGVYTASYTDGNTCKSSAIFTLMLNALPTALSVAASATYCQNATAAQLTATGTNLNWYTAATGGTAVTTAPTPTTSTVGTINYYVSQTTNTCESSRTLLSVTVNALPTAAITRTTPTTFCTGRSVVLTTSSGSSYKWFNGRMQVGTAQTYTATTAGSYTVEVTNAGNCKATSTATVVTVNALPTAAITTTTPTIFCTVGSVVLTASAGSSYVWKNGRMQVGTAQTYTATTAGSYTVEVTNASNCKATSEATTVTVNALPTAVITTTTPATFCEGGSLVLTASAGSSYKWMNGTTQVGTAQTYTATSAGSYTVEITNANNCKATSAATTVAVNAIPSAPSVVATAAYCQNVTAAQLSATGTNLKWYTAATGGTSVATAPTLPTATIGTTSYYVSQTTNTCESARSFIAVTVNAMPAVAITANGSTAINQGEGVVFTASSGSSYKWMNGTTIITGATAKMYRATAAGSYTVEVTNASNCKAISVAMNVTLIATTTNQPSVITITSPQSNSTVAVSINIAVNVTDADGSIALVEFLDGNTVIGISTTAPYTYTLDSPSAGGHTITVRVTDSNRGITISAPVVVTSAISTTTGVQSSNTLNASIYPNPSNSDVYIDIDVDLSNVSFRLLDVLGREVPVSFMLTGSGAQIDVSNLSEGAYVMIIKQDNSILRNKITVIK